ncbi:MAG: hypothetical protein Q9201_005877 [Fulgogasparrea decipioides]
MEKVAAQAGFKGHGARKKPPANDESLVARARIIESNAKNSPLLNLPAEIRKMIFGYVVGDQLIHIESLPSSYPRDERFTLRHSVCSAGTSEAAAYKQSILGCSTVPDEEDSQYYVEDCLGRHSECGIEAHRDNSSENFLSLLRVSHQIYAEAMYLVWTTNTFSFSGGRAFSKFIWQLYITQRRTLAKIHLHRGQHSDDTWFWYRAISQRLLTSLQGLKSIELCLDLEGCAGYWSSWREEHDSSTASYFLGPILNFRQLPLESVKVMVSDRSGYILPAWVFADRASPLYGIPNTLVNENQVLARFTWLEKRRLACYFEMCLLGRVEDKDIPAEVARKLHDEQQAREAFLAEQNQQKGDHDAVNTNVETENEDGGDNVEVAKEGDGMNEEAENKINGDSKDGHNEGGETDDGTTSN